MRPERPKIEAEGRQRGRGSWGGGSKPLAHQLGGLGRTVRSPSGVIAHLVLLYDFFST